MLLYPQTLLQISSEVMAKTPAGRGWRRGRFGKYGDCFNAEDRVEKICAATMFTIDTTTLSSCINLHAFVRISLRFCSP